MLAGAALVGRLSGRDVYGNATPLAPADISLTATPPDSAADLHVAQLDGCPEEVELAFAPRGEGRLQLTVAGQLLASWALAPPPSAPVALAALPPGWTAGPVPMARPLCVTLAAVDAAGQPVMDGDCEQLRLAASAVWQGKCAQYPHPILIQCVGESLVGVRRGGCLSAALSFSC